LVDKQNTAGAVAGGAVAIAVAAAGVLPWAGALPALAGGRR